MNFYKIGNDTIDNVYVLRGKVLNSSLWETKTYRYIQGIHSPHIVTRTGYRADSVICFPTKSAAWDFLNNFLRSPKRRKTHVNTQWDVVDYKPFKYKEILSKRFQLIARRHEDYGLYYTLRLEDFIREGQFVLCESKVENKNLNLEGVQMEEKTVDVLFNDVTESLEVLKNSLSELVSFVKDMPEKKEQKVDLFELLENADEDVWDELMIKIRDHYDTDEIMDYLNKDGIEEFVLDNYRVDEIFSEDDILEYVRDNCYVEDLISFDWR